MGLLATCPRCKTTYVSGQACPSCNYREGVAEGEETDWAAAYASRRFWHIVAYSAYMVRGLAGGLLALGLILMCWIGMIMAGIMIVIAIGAGTLAQIVLFVLRDCRQLHCPACDTRLDELPMEHGRCPGCRAKLL